MAHCTIIQKKKKKSCIRMSLCRNGTDLFGYACKVAHTLTCIMWDKYFPWPSLLFINFIYFFSHFDECLIVDQSNDRFHFGIDTIHATYVRRTYCVSVMYVWMIGSTEILQMKLVSKRCVMIHSSYYSIWIFNLSCKCSSNEMLSADIERLQLINCLNTVSWHQTFCSNRLKTNKL